MNRVSDKRERLIESAAKLFHQAGFKDTSIADIAKDSGVPLGNVYYYFKTKDDLAAAVIEQRTETIKGWTRQWEENPDPKERLFQLLDFHESHKDQVAKFGGLGEGRGAVTRPTVRQARTSRSRPGTPWSGSR